MIRGRIAAEIWAEKRGIVGIHDPGDCAGEACVFHNPSGHSMADRPMNLRESGLIERVCGCGVGHPDPDSAAWLNRRLGDTTWGVHGCCGCCV